MVDRILLSANAANIAECIELATERGLGIELMTFSVPDLLDGDWQAAVEQHRAMLQSVPGAITMHGPFMDMAPGSPDRRISQITLDRYRLAIRIAESLGVETLVFHANFIAAIRTERYRMSWHQRNVDFWGGVAEDAQAHGVTLVAENMWEYDPDILGDLLRAIGSPALRACLDVGHAHLYSDVSLEGWLDVLGSFLVHTHMNNNDGVQDLHRCFTSPAGVIDYHAVLNRMRALPVPPTVTLEMDTVDDMRDSLGYFDLPDPSQRWRACTKPASTF